MTPADQLREAQLARQQAGQDIADIEALSKFEAFNRYWMRQLQQKHAAMERRFKYDAATGEQREAWRQQLLAYEELRDMPKVHRVVCQRALEAPPPVPGQRPMQAN